MKVRNRIAQRDYELHDTYEAGIVLEGHEVKAIRNQGAMLDSSYVKLTKNGAMLVNASIPRYKFAGKDDLYDPTRSRKLLLHKKELLQIMSKMEQKGNVTLIPTAIYTSHGKLKLEFAIAKARKTWEKKKIKARKTENRRIEKEMKEFMKK